MSSKYSRGARQQLRPPICKQPPPIPGPITPPTPHEPGYFCRVVGHGTYLDQPYTIDQEVKLELDTGHWTYTGGVYDIYLIQKADVWDDKNTPDPAKRTHCSVSIRYNPSFMYNILNQYEPTVALPADLGPFWIDNYANGLFTGTIKYTVYA